MFEIIISYEEVCEEWSRSWLLESRELDLMPYVNSSSIAVNGRPSWSIDIRKLSQPLDQGVWVQPFSISLPRLYAASSTTIPRFTFNDRGNLLNLSGFDIGAVDVLGEPMQGTASIKGPNIMEEPSFLNRFQITSWVDFMWRIMIPVCPYRTDRTSRDTDVAFWRTVLADQKRPPFRHAERLGAEFGPLDIDLLQAGQTDQSLSFAIENLFRLLRWADWSLPATRPAWGSDSFFFRGGSVPFVIRDLGDGSYRLIGEA